MMSGIQLIVSSSMPPALRMFSIDALGACHHLRCSLRSSFLLCSSVPILSIRRLLSILNLVQSDGVSSVDGANSLTLGPLGTPMSDLGALSPGVPETELLPVDVGGRSDDEDDGCEVLGLASVRSGGGLVSSVEVKS